jgi:endonuclease/exonuclease/phosphatase family metal-dependent hydrolase
VAADTRPDEVVLRVATFNAQHGVGRLGLVSHRGLVDTCRSLDAEILALQEVDRRVIRSSFRDQPALIARALAMQHVTARAKRTPFGGSQCNALCARGHFEDVEAVDLPRHEGDENRVAVLARIVLAGASISVACTHLQHRGGNAREQLAAVLETLCLRPGPRLIAGDFNLTEKDVEPLLAARGFTAAPSGPTSPAHEPRRRIDWIAVDAGLAVLGSRLHQPIVGDHCPLVADIAVRPAP